MQKSSDEQNLEGFLFESVVFPHRRELGPNVDGCLSDSAALCSPSIRPAVFVQTAVTDNWELQAQRDSTWRQLQLS